jgi:hypothetical protein
MPSITHTTALQGLVKALHTAQDSFGHRLDDSDFAGLVCSTALQCRGLRRREALEAGGSRLRPLIQFIGREVLNIVVSPYSSLYCVPP